MYLHQGEHGGNPPNEMVNRWFTHYLYGVENGVKADAPVWIVETPPAPRVRGTPPVPTPAPAPFASFPAPGSENVVLRPTRGGTAVATLTMNAAQGVDTLVDDVAMSGSAVASVAESRHRLLYTTGLLRDTLRISGTARVTLRVASSKPAANLSVWLVTLPYDSAMIGSQGHVGVVTRGWADIQNHESLTRGGNYDSKRPGQPLVPGRFYDLTFDLEPDHQLIPPGKQLAVLIMSSDREFTLWPQPGTLLMVDLARSSFSIPIVGGAAALSRVGGM
jgi:X-Pro dipeptidyl-peptidase